MVDFLKGLSFLILPLGLGSKRMEFFEKEIKKFSGTVNSESKPTHVIIEETAGENRVKCIAALSKRGINVNDDVKLVGTKWLSRCFAEKKLVDAREFEFTWREAGKKCPKKTIRVGGKNILAAGGKAEDAENPNGSLPEKKQKTASEERMHPLLSTSDGAVSEKKKLIADELRKLADAFSARNDTWRAYSYGNAVSAILRYDKDITSFHEARKIPGIGERMALKIMEILESGKLGKVEEVLDEKTKILECFCNIWGVGPSTAEHWYLRGCRHLEDLRKNKVKLTKQQEIGLKYYDDFTRKIPREEVERIAAVIDDELKNIPGRCRTELVGSYRRGRPTCGDVDIMLINLGPKNPLDVLIQLTDRLRQKNYLTDDLVGLDEKAFCDESGHRKYLGVFRFPGEREIHRRIDIFVIPESEYAAGLMHYTGSALYNRRIRLLASKKGMTLNERGLYTGVVRKGSDILNEGELVPTSTEKDIFDHLGLEFRLPEERDH